MRLPNWLKRNNINQRLEEYDASPQALLLDVRTEQEYKQGHIPGSRNIPLHCIEDILALTHSKHVPLFVYCYSGARSRRAVQELQHLGYTDVRNLGGISAYRGRVALG